MDLNVSARASGGFSIGNGGSASNRIDFPAAENHQLDTFNARVAAGDKLTPVEQGTMARLMDAERGGEAGAGSAAAKAGAAVAAVGAAAAKAATPHAKTAADFKITGGTKQDKADLNTALKYLQQTDSNGKAVSPTATKLIAKMKEGATIHIIHDGNDSYDPSTGVLNWDPKSGLQVTSGQGVQSAALGLVHEMDHEVNGTVGRPTGDGYQNTEEKRVIAGSETTIAHDLGEPTRKDHYGSTVVMTTANAHTDVKSGKVVDGAIAARAATKH